MYTRPFAIIEVYHEMAENAYRWNEVFFHLKTIPILLPLSKSFQVRGIPLLLSLMTFYHQAKISCSPICS